MSEEQPTFLKVESAQENANNFKKRLDLLDNTNIAKESEQMNVDAMSLALVEQSKFLSQ